MVKEYVFYTFEGYTESPIGKPVENIQILGFEFGENEQSARRRLMRHNPWIIEKGFHKDMTMYRQVI